MQPITGKTKILGVIGDPIAHSLSPAMHNRAIEALGLDYVYLPFRICPEDLGAGIAGFAAIGVQGFSITIPHKQAIIPLLSEVSDLAQAVGAVNTVWWNGQGWSGTNTDVAGFLAPLKSLRSDWHSVQAIILGNGGAARAVVAACHQLGCAAIHIVGRDPHKLREFQASWVHSPLQVKLQVHTWDTLPDLLGTTQILVNTTPMGMHPHVNASPLNLDRLSQLPQDAIVYDIIYTPRPTRLLQEAQSLGLKVLDGLEMLVQQGAIALEQWVQQPAPIAVMRQALESALAQK